LGELVGFFIFYFFWGASSWFGLWGEAGGYALRLNLEFGVFVVVVTSLGGLTR
jgi:hypothetical protein